MLSFECDYNAGAHTAILARLAETNFEPLPGYGAPSALGRLWIRSPWMGRCRSVRSVDGVEDVGKPFYRRCKLECDVPLSGASAQNQEQDA